MKTNFKVTGMTCNHCVDRVQKGIESLNGVQKVKVNLKKELATVKFDESVVSTDAIVEKVIDAGYHAEVI